MQHRQHVMSAAAAHSGLECEMQLNNTMWSVCGFGVGHQVMCDGVGEGGKQSSKSIQECFRCGTNL